MPPAPLRRLLTLATFLFALTCATLGFAVEPAGCAAGKPVPVERIQEVEDAIERFQANDFKAAFELLKEAAKKDPSLQRPMYGRGVLRLWAAPRDILEKAAFERPDDPEAYVFLADMNLCEGRYTEADLLLTKAAALLPGLKDEHTRQDTLRLYILAGQAGVAEYRENWRGAGKLLEEFVALDPKNANALQRLGRALFQQGKKSTRKAAYARFKEAKAIDPDVLLPEAQMAQLCEAARQHAEAQKWMERALKAASKDDVVTRLAAAKWALESDQLDKAKQWSDDALAIDPKNAKALNVRGIVALYKEDYKTAEQYFETAHLMSPADFAASNNLALALVEQNDARKARRALAMAEFNVREYGGRAEAHAALGQILFKFGRLDEAEDALCKAIKLGGDGRTEAAKYLLRVMEEKHRRDKRKKETEKSDLERMLEPK